MLGFQLGIVLGVCLVVGRWFTLDLRSLLRTNFYWSRWRSCSGSAMMAVVRHGNQLSEAVDCIAMAIQSLDDSLTTLARMRAVMKTEDAATAAPSTAPVRYRVSLTTMNISLIALVPKLSG